VSPVPQSLDTFGVQSPESLVGLLGNRVHCQKLPCGFRLWSVCWVAAGVELDFASEIMTTASTFPMDWAQEAHVRGFRRCASSVLMYTLCISDLNMAHNPFLGQKEIFTSYVYISLFSVNAQP